MTQKTQNERALTDIAGQVTELAEGQRTLATSFEGAVTGLARKIELLTQQAQSPLPAQPEDLTEEIQTLREAVQGLHDSASGFDSLAAKLNGMAQDSPAPPQPSDTQAGGIQETPGERAVIAGPPDQQYASQAPPNSGPGAETVAPNDHFQGQSQAGERASTPFSSEPYKTTESGK